jgi:hypothetical protein
VTPLRPMNPPTGFMPLSQMPRIFAFSTGAS